MRWRCCDDCPTSKPTRKSGLTVRAKRVGAKLTAMRLRGNRYRRRLLPDRRQPAMPREAPSSVPKFLTAALVWTVTAGIFVYICSRIPMVRDHEWFVAWAALSALPWLTIWGQRRRAPVSAAKVEDHREHRSQTNRSDSVNRQEGVFDSAAAKRRSPEDLRGASPGRIDLDGDETTVGLGHTATTSPPTFGSNGFHDTRPLNRLTGEDRRPDRQLTYDHAPDTGPWPVRVLSSLSHPRRYETQQSGLRADHANCPRCSRRSRRQTGRCCGVAGCS